MLETLDEAFNEWGIYEGSKNYPTWNHIKWRLEQKMAKANGREGTWTSWYENGQKKSEINYKDYDELQIPEGLPIFEQNGAAIEWYENGQIKSEGNYAENCKIGKFKEWYESGGIKSITLYCAYTFIYKIIIIKLV